MPGGTPDSSSVGDQQLLLGRHAQTLERVTRARQHWKQLLTLLALLPVTSLVWVGISLVLMPAIFCDALSESEGCSGVWSFVTTLGFTVLGVTVLWMVSVLWAIARHRRRRKAYAEEFSAFRGRAALPSQGSSTDATKLLDTALRGDAMPHRVRAAMDALSAMLILFGVTGALVILAFLVAILYVVNLPAPEDLPLALHLLIDSAVLVHMFRRAWQTRRVFGDALPDLQSDLRRTLAAAFEPQHALGPSFQSWNRHPARAAASTP